jgi:hypothetical protein
MVDQMRKRLAVDRHSQFPAVREVRLAQLPRPMFLRKEYFSWGTFRRSPVTDPPPQCPDLSITESAWMLFLQMLEQSLGL